MKRYQGLIERLRNYAYYVSWLDGAACQLPPETHRKLQVLVLTLDEAADALDQLTREVLRVAALDVASPEPPAEPTPESEA